MDIRFFPDRPAADMHRRFPCAEICTSAPGSGAFRRGTYAVGSGFACLAATYRPGSPRHLSVGRFRWKDVRAFRAGQKKGQRTMHPDTICYLPWTFLEIEDGDLLDRLHYTRSLLTEMKAEGFETKDMHLRFSGNESLWLAIPASLMGHPVGSVADQKALRQRLFRPLTRQRLDEGLFDARHLHRLLGSTHEKGSRTRVLPLGALENRSALSFALGRTPNCSPPPDPGEACETLLNRARQKTRFHVPPFESVRETEAGGMFMADTKEGVGEGRRNETAFKRACVLWQRHSRRDAWLRLKEWNRKCDPPLGEKELSGCFKSARRTALEEISAPA